MKLISSPADFPNVQVFLTDAGALRLEFINPEQSTYSDKVAGLMVVAFGGYVFLILAGGPGWLMKEYLPREWEEAAAAFASLWVLAVLGVALWVLGKYGLRRMFTPLKVKRVIELDPQKGELRVFRGKEQKLKQALPCRNLTIEPHPLAEREWRRRGGKSGPKQLQHCLVGWFGAAGAYKVPLVCRWESPRQESLYEVRQALLWGIEAVARGAEPQPAARRGFRPPLD